MDCIINLFILFSGHSGFNEFLQNDSGTVLDGRVDPVQPT
jgi:hypothetical protein